MDKMKRVGADLRVCPDHGNTETSAETVGRGTAETGGRETVGCGTVGRGNGRTHRSAPTAVCLPWLATPKH